MKFELLIALRYLKSKQREKLVSLITVISIAGVTVGVAALITVLAVMSGFDNEFKEKIIGTNSHIVIQKEGGIEDIGYVLGILEGIPHIVSAAPFVNGQIILRYKDDAMGALVRGIDTEREIATTKIASYIKKGSFDLSEKKIIIGSEYADKLRLDIGDKLTVISPYTGKASDFNVSGVFNSGMYDYDLNLVFINLKDSQLLFDIGNNTTGISVRVDDEFKVNSIRKQINAELGYPFWTRSWIDLNKNLFAALKLEKTVMFIILTLIVLVACFNIASTLIMIVLEKIKDIGILRAIGATKKNIMNIFTLHGFIIGFLGTLLGSTLGLILCYLLKEYQFVKLPSDVYYIDKLPVLVNPVDTIIIAAAALVLSFLATLYPSYSASRFEPVEAIRYE